MNITSRSITMLAALAAAALSLGVATANADVAATCTEDATSCTAEIAPGLTCVRDGGLFTDSTTCTNTSNTDFTVLQTTQCRGGDYAMPSFGPKGEMSWYYGSIDPSTEFDSIFAPANFTATVPSSDCDLDVQGVTFSPTAPTPPAN